MKKKNIFYIISTIFMLFIIVLSCHEDSTIMTVDGKDIQIPKGYSLLKVNVKIPAKELGENIGAKVVDTTGAGDAFAAGFIAAALRGERLEAACEAGNAAGARIVSRLGAVSAWFD